MSQNGASSRVLAYDLLVVGGGPAGIGAVVAAGRMGVKVALIERHDVLGGMGTAGLVNNFCPAHLDGERLIIGGIFAEIRQLLIDRKAIFAAKQYSYAMEPYNPVVFAEISEDLVRESGSEIHFHARLTDVSVNNDGGFALSLDGGSTITGKALVDATGDAMVAAATGVPFTFGRASDNAVMPLTYCYKLGPINLERVEKEMPGAIRHDPNTEQPFLCISGAHQEVARAQASGDLSIPRDHVASIMNIPGEPENGIVNFGRVFIEDPTDPQQLADAEEEGRGQIEDGVRFFRKYLPGFEKAEILETARQIGVRESRQIKGLYTLDRDDVLGCRQFEDVIAQCCYALDVHNPDSDGTELVELERGTHYDIPLRSLIPSSGPTDLIVAGRSISATQEAMSSFRVSPSAMAIGEAAGVTAALALKNGYRMREVEYNLVQNRLKETGAILD